jgi:DNA-binding NarL/FixJ family response regulator
MPGFRAILVSVPPLLADLTRHVMTGRAGFSIIAEIADPDTTAECLHDLAPDVVIIGPAANARNLNAAIIRSMLPRAKVLALSADFTQLFGPGEHDVTVFTPDALADRLRQEDRNPRI